MENSNFEVLVRQSFEKHEFAILILRKKMCCSNNGKVCVVRTTKKCLLFEQQNILCCSNNKEFFVVRTTKDSLLFEQQRILCCSNNRTFNVFGKIQKSKNQRKKSVVSKKMKVLEFSADHFGYGTVQNGEILCFSKNRTYRHIAERTTT